MEEEYGPLQKRVNEKEEPNDASLDLLTFDACVGEYELGPGFVLKLWREGDQAYTQATGQAKAELFMESATTYFLKVAFVKGADGKAESLVLHQGGKALPGKRG